MTLNNKVKYETPLIVPLGELAKGSGICVEGSVPSPSQSECTVGPVPRFEYPNDCPQGHGARVNCGGGSAVGKKPKT